MMPRKGKEVGQVCSIRLEPTTKERLVEQFGTLQGAIDFLVSLDEKKINSLKPKQKKEK